MSRRAFGALTRSEALDVLRRWHPDVSLLPAWRGPDLPAGHQIVDYEGDFSARLEGEDGRRDMVVSSNVPLRARDRAGRERPVDLSLEEIAGSFWAANPLAAVRLNSDLAEGLELSTPGIVVHPVVSQHWAPVVSEDTLLYANALVDTDIVVRPAPTGFTVDLHVRSEDSPEHFALDLDVQDGLSIRVNQPAGAVEIVRGDNVVATVTAPVAWDADGRPVELTWRLDGHRLAIDVPHRGQDLAYPLLVDPSVIEAFEWERYGANNAAGNFFGWEYRWDASFAGMGWAGNDTWMGSGLYIRNNSSRDYDNNDSGDHNFRPPGYARVFRVEWAMADQKNWDESCTQFGIVAWAPTSSPGTWYPGYAPWQSCAQHLNAYINSTGPGNAGDTARFRLTAKDVHKVRGPLATQVGVVYLYMEDRDLPSVASDLPSGWVNWPAATPLSFWSIDTSLGVSTMTVSAPGSPSWPGATVSSHVYGSRCGRANLCPRSATTGEPVDAPATVGNLPEGVNTIQVIARDPAGNRRGAQAGTQSDPNLTGTDVVTGQGLRGEYYDNGDFTTDNPAYASDPSKPRYIGPKLTRLDQGINFTWSTSPDTSPPAGQQPRIGDEHFTVRWTGYLDVQQAGNYEFQTVADDGIRVWVGDMQAAKINSWRVGTATTSTSNAVYLTQARHRIVIEYLEHTGTARAELRWKPPGGSFVVIPKERLSPPNGWTLKLDRTKPTIISAGGTLRRDAVGDGVHELHIETHDNKPGVADTSGVSTIEVFVTDPGGVETRKHLASNTNSTTFQFDARASTYGAGNGYAEGQHAVRVKVTDRAGNFAEDGFDVAVDRTAPSFNGSVAVDGTFEQPGHAVVSWYPALDPNLPDGTAGAGVSGYSGRYRRNGGSWVDVAFSAYPVVEYDGAQLGESVDVELRAHDAAGNIGPVTTGTTTVSDTSPCSGDSDPNCQGPGPDEDVDAEQDPEFDMVEDQSASGAEPRAAGDATLYHLQIKEEVCRTNRCWSTIRNRPQSWAVGQARLEYSGPGEADEDVKVTSLIAEQERTDKGWSLGTLSWYSDSCGWVRSKRVASPVRTTNQQCPDNFGPDFKDWQAKPFGGRYSGKLVRGNNCQNSTGTYRKIGPTTCDSGTAIFLTGPGVQCANVYVLPTGNTLDRCMKKDIVTTIGSNQWSGYCVNWRYVTKDRNWVMVRDNRQDLRGGWVFMPIRSFQTNRSQWPAYNERGTCNNPDAHNE